MRSVLAFFIIISAFCITSPAQADRTASLAAVVAAENAFADAAAKNGVRAAFLAYAADNGVVFSDKPDNAKESWQKRAANDALLAWRPAWADVSASGDLGYTTGSWSYARTASGDPAAWGEYFTIWRKQADGTWKFALDLGIGHDKAEVVKNNWRSPSTLGKPSTSADVSGSWKTLETSFADSLSKNGTKKAYEKLASGEIRLLRDGKMPFQGRAAALGLVMPAEFRIRPIAGEMSSDMAYSYGEYDLKTADGKNEKGFYARVWKRERSGWRIAAEVLHPVPPPKN